MSFNSCKNIFLTGVFFLFCHYTSFAQQISGQVMETVDGKTLPAQGAFVHCLNHTSGTVTDSVGNFSLARCLDTQYLIVESVTSSTDTIVLKAKQAYYKITLQPGAEMLKAATAVGKKQTYGMRSIDPKTTINLNEREFQKAACCNLSESFENAPAIDVNYGDAVTGTKQIKMLGLDGFYSMISREFMPSVRLLNSYYGMSFIPASWVKGIQITKGAGSVVNGYESISGQINIEMKKPFDKEKIMWDQFFSGAGRTETDLMYRYDISAKLATSLFVRTAFYPLKMDRNEDGFLDNPTGNQFQVMNRWQFLAGKSFEGEVSASYNNDKKNAGQVDFYEKKQGSGYYGIGINNEQFDVWAKLGRVFKDKPYKSFGSQYGFNQSQMTSTYGSAASPFTYHALAKSFYTNLMFQSIIKTTVHGYKVGISAQIDDLNESVGYEGKREVYDRFESVTGAFLEYTYKPNEKLSVVGGIRSDYNNIYGLSVTPRLHTKYRFNKEKTTIRMSGGMGRRTSNIFSQNQQMFASSRSIQIISDKTVGAYGLDQEVAINTGISVEHKMKWGLWPATILVDYFHTTFLNEVVFDREIDSVARFYNMENGTRANSFQFQLDFNPLRRTEIRLAYRLFDVQTKYLDGRFGYAKYLSGDNPEIFSGRIDKPFVARHRGFLNITQNTRNNWQFSTTLQIYGPQRIPGYNQTVSIIGFGFIRKYSPAFITLNAQISKKVTSKFEAYLGAENVLNYKQTNPIVNAVNPFEKGFDASLVWGPVFGRMIYGGFRWRLSNE